MYMNMYSMYMVLLENYLLYDACILVWQKI